MAREGAGTRDYAALLERYRALCLEHRALLEKYRAEISGDRAREGGAGHDLEDDRLRAVADLASRVAHEVNNALHAIALRIGSLRGLAAPEERDRHLTVLMRMVSDAAECVTRLQISAGCSRAGNALLDPTRERPGGGARARRSGPGRRRRSGAPPDPLRLRVLVVDDDSDVLEAAGIALEHLGHEVTLARSGASAVERVASGERYDVVLCDIAMPNVDGWEVASRIAEASPETRLYLVSGGARELRPEQTTGPGVCGVLAKPLSLEALQMLLARERGAAGRAASKLGSGRGLHGG